MGAYQRVMMHWQVILEVFGPTIQNVFVVDNIVADTLITLLSILVSKYK